MPIIRNIRFWVAAYGFSAPSFWMGGGLDSRCIGCVYGADVAVRRLSRPPPIQKLGAENHMLQPKI